MKLSVKLERLPPNILLRSIFRFQFTLSDSIVIKTALHLVLVGHTAVMGSVVVDHIAATDFVEVDHIARMDSVVVLRIVAMDFVEVDRIARMDSVRNRLVLDSADHTVTMDCLRLDLRRNRQMIDRIHLDPEHRSFGSAAAVAMAVNILFAVRSMGMGLNQPRTKSKFNSMHNK